MSIYESNYGYELGLVEGVQQERERIIKLLNLNQCHDSTCTSPICENTNRLVALIKGEK